MEIKTISGVSAKNCPKCAIENSDTAKFCKACGFDFRTVVAVPQQETQAGRLCIKCKTTNALNAKFCKACGTPTTEVAAALSPPSVVVPAPPLVAALPAAVPISPPLAPPPAPPVPPPTPAMKQLSPTLPQPPRPPALGPVPSFPAQAPNKLPSNPGNKEAGNINSGPKPTGIKKYVVWGGALAAVLALAGAGAYWVFSGSSKPADKPAAAPINPAASAAALAVAPASAPPPLPAEVPASVALPAPASAVGAVQSTESPKTTVAPRAETRPEKAPEPPPPAARKFEGELEPSIAQDKRKAEEAAIKRRGEREALAKQRERDKAKLNNTNRTLDDLLK